MTILQQQAYKYTAYIQYGKIDSHQKQPHLQVAQTKTYHWLRRLCKSKKQYLKEWTKTIGSLLYSSLTPGSLHHAFTASLLAPSSSLFTTHS